MLDEEMTLVGEILLRGGCGRELLGDAVSTG
jgi:hypothetical protein